MDSTKNTASSSKVYLVIAMAVVAIILAVISSSNGVRAFLRQSSENYESRIILAKIFTNYNSTRFTVFKIRSESGIEVEIYETDKVTYTESLKQKFSFANDKDAFLMVNGNSVSLALSDVDQSGVPEIIVPTVDQYGLSRLNVFKYDETLNQFSQTLAEE